MSKQLFDIIDEFRSIENPIKLEVEAKDMSASDGKDFAKSKETIAKWNKISNVTGYFGVLMLFIALFTAFGIACSKEGGEMGLYSMLTFTTLIVSIVYIIKAFKNGKFDLFTPRASKKARRNDWICSISALIGYVCGFLAGGSTSRIVLAVMVAIFVVLKVVGMYGYKVQTNNLNQNGNLEGKYESVIELKKEQEKQRQERVEELVKMAYPLGVQLCSVRQLERFSRFSKNCPVCSSQLEESPNKYVARYYALHQEKLQGVYVGSGFDTVRDATRSGYYEKDFEAKAVVCPHCKCEYMSAEVTYHELKKDEITDLDGDKIPHISYVERKKTVEDMNPGMLLSTTFDKWKATHTDKDVTFIKKEVSNLIKCADCGKEFSPHAKACPNCGCPAEVSLKK